MKTALAAGLLALSLNLLAAAAEDRAAVEAVVRETYVQGVHARPDAAAMRRGFHPDFRMLVLREGRLQAVGQGGSTRCVRGAASGEWIPLPYVDEAATEKLFRHKVLALLLRRGS
jgi:hypothetical protein